jgi:hypothetical protein
MQKLLMFAATLLGLWATTAYCESRWVIAGEYGQKPERILVLIDLGETKLDEIRGEYGPGGLPYSNGPKKKSVNESVDAAEVALAAVVGKTTGPFISVPMWVVYESADKPDYSNGTIRNFCDRKINDIYWPFTYWRNDTSSKDESAIALSTKREVMDKVLNLTCGDTQAAFVAGGFKPIVGDDAKTTYPTNYPWKSVWLDGKRPASAEIDQATLDAREAKIRATIADTQAMLGKSEAIALGQIKKSNDESAFWIDQAERRKHRPKSKLNPFLEGWLRQNEQYIVHNLGVPDGLYVVGNSRFLTYFNGWSQVFTTSNALTGEVVGSSQKDYVCELTMELQDDKMIDFKFKGNSCGFGEFSGR